MCQNAIVSWLVKKRQLQQDDAPAYRTINNVTVITKQVFSGSFLDWPQCSPDLSPIETTWASMDHQLHKEYKPTNIKVLKQSLQGLHKSIPIAMLHRLSNNLDARMKRIIPIGYIGKW